ncbi:MAG: MATE family efflux transporter [Lachnospiraceae bacterium]|nr:MATE family efflux transporter [Lachnospiraceae bacterium]
MTAVQMEQMERDEKKRIIRTTLDMLPDGKPPEEGEDIRIRKVTLPEGVKRGSLSGDVVRIAWPCLIELILTQLTSMVDQMMVGRLPGQEGIMALSAVGLAAQPKFLLMTLVIAMNVGSTAVIARYRGQRNQKKANQTYRQAILLNLLLSVVFMGVGILGAEPLIRFMGAGGITQETLRYGTEYLRIQMYGLIPLVLTVTTTAALRGVGDTRIPLLYNTVANVVNVIGNYLLIYGKGGFPAMGVAGASLATVIGQTVAFGMAAAVAFSKKRYIFLDFKEGFRFDPSIMRSVVAIGTPSMMEQLFLRLGAILYVRTVAGLGDTMYAAHNVLLSIMSMTFMIGQAFATSATTLMGQSLGKLRRDMAALYMKETRRLGLYVSCLMLVGMALFRVQIIGLYNSTPEVVEIGSQILFLLAFLQPVQTDQFIVSGGLRGAGDTRYTAAVIAVSVLFVRNVLGTLMVKLWHLGLWGAWIAMSGDQGVRALLILHRYYSGKWSLIRLKEEMG